MQSRCQRAVCACYNGAMTDRAAYAVIALLTVIVVGLVAWLTLTNGTAPGALNVAALPLVNACLNSVSAVLLVAGGILIRQRKFTAHVACMAGAFGVSTLFLVSYVTYHYHAGSRPFTGQGFIRPIYFAILISHIVLAALIVPLALTTIYHGWRALRHLAPRRRAGDAPGLTDPSRRPAPPLAKTRHLGTTTHAKIARWTLPVWLYVSVSGVLVYVLLHHW